MLRLYVLSNKKKMIPFPWHDISHYNILNKSCQEYFNDIIHARDIEMA
jgi:hypothetical protein